jgi:hypothetical protein
MLTTVMIGRLMAKSEMTMESSRLPVVDPLYANLGARRDT